MYQMVISHHPAPGKGPALRAAIEERSKAANAAGSQHAVSQVMFPDEPTFVNSIRFESLAAMEEYMQRRAGDEAAQAAIRKISENVARPQTPKLFELLVPATPSGEVKYVLFNSFVPAVGKVQEMRGILQETVSGETMTGSVGAALGVQVAPEVPNFIVAVLFSSLAGLDEWRHSLWSNQRFLDFQSKISGLQDRHVRQELHQVLMPFPS